MVINISREEVANDGFLTEEEVDGFFMWLEKTVLVIYPKDNTHEKLLDYLQVYKEMMFQST